MIKYNYIILILIIILLYCTGKKNNIYEYFESSLANSLSIMEKKFNDTFGNSDNSTFTFNKNIKMSNKNISDIDTINSNTINSNSLNSNKIDNKNINTGNININKDGNLCIGNTCINENNLKILTGQKNFSLQINKPAHLQHTNKFLHHRPDGVTVAYGANDKYILSN